ncbi:MAG: DUF885 domain-containing protein [Chitinophagales bacterium]
MKYLVFGLSFILLIAGCESKKSGPLTSFSEFEDEFVDTLWKYNPVWASSIGYHAYDSVLPIPNETTTTAYLQFLNAEKKALAGYSYEKLTPSEKCDYKLIEDFLHNGIFSIREFKANEWDPSQYNVGGAIDAVLNNSKATLETNLRMLAGRLHNIPDYYQAARKQIKNPSREHTDLAIAQNEGLSYFFKSALPDSIKKSNLSVAEKEQLQAQIDQADEAVASFVTFLKERRALGDKAAWRSCRIGKELYLSKFRYEIQSHYSADEVYAKALIRKKELLNEMYGLSQSIWPNYIKTAAPSDSLQLIRETLSFLSQKHCHKDSFIATIEKQLPELTVFINSKHIIDLDSSKPLRVRKTPEYMAGVAGASINSPGPYDKEQATYYNVTPLTGYSSEKAESYLREYNNYILEILNIHEAIPGHYTQQIYANRSPSLIKTILGNGAMIEGWACYVERMLLEEGYHHSPEMQLFYCKWNLREVGNFILDYNVQVNNWNEQQVKHLLVEECFQESAEASEKYKRALLTQVQLTSYFTGQTEILELREAMKKKESQRFDLKNFHEQFLSYGSAPVTAISELMLH